MRGLMVRVGAFAAVLAMGVSGGVSGAGASEASMAVMSDAEKLERLDIMLMVTGLRCRTGEDDFQAEYMRFQTKHSPELNSANRQLHSLLMKRLGAAAAERELDHINVEMANNYGNGHPTLGCHDLKTVTKSLADSDGASDLLAAAGQLLDTPASVRLASQP